MALHVILGKGSVGSATAELLAERGNDVRVLSRSGGRSQERMEHVAVDATDARALTAATIGAAALYNCAQPTAYHRWAAEWPPIAAALLDTAEATGAVLVTMSNLYGYGPVDRPMTEDLPLAATGTKGRIRARMWTDALARHRAGRARVTEARASDFFGPGITTNGHLGQRVVPAVLRGRGVRVLGDPDAPHSWTYIGDVARTLVRLGTDERALGRAWHVPSAPPLSRREAVRLLCQAAGVVAVPVRAIPWWVVRLAAVAAPPLREMPEVRHQFDRSFVLDSSAYTATFGETATPPEVAFAATVRWWRDRLAEARPSGAAAGGAGA
jgi:nucleoside-diphosphate-sugar epimerase